MQITSWDERYSLGVEAIDKQHKQLFELIYKLDFAVEKQEEMAVISGLLQALVDYTQYHFIEEESHLVILNKEDYELHKQQHQFFIERLTVFKEQSERIGTVSLGLLYFLKDWLIQHIQIEDKKYIAA